jgi:hypothetical protein
MLKISEALIKFDEQPVTGTEKIRESAERILQQYRMSQKPNPNRSPTAVK